MSYQRKHQRNQLIAEEDPDYVPEKNGGGGGGRISDRERFLRIFYLESLAGLWIAIVIAIIILGSAVYFNLHFVIGFCIAVTGGVLLIVVLIEIICWQVIGEVDVERLNVVRKIVLVPKELLLTIIIGLSIWAGVVMLQRAL